jgi:TnpA family transposase
MTDTASYSDVVFGLFSLLGYRFSPRLADLPDKRFWRFDMTATYGALDGISRHRLDRKLIVDNWEDILRIVGSLKLGRIRASEVLRMLKYEDRPTTLGRAIAEVGRISKTVYLLNYLADESYRRRIEIQLNRGEARHALARAIFYGQRGELRQAYREGQEEQLGALGLMVNIVVIWNTLYQDRILSDLRRRGVEVLREDIERLSPLGRDHIKLHGHYPFALADVVQQGGYLPLRDWEEGDVTFQ